MFAATNLRDDARRSNPRRRWRRGSMRRYPGHSYHRGDRCQGRYGQVQGRRWNCKRRRGMRDGHGERLHGFLRRRWRFLNHRVVNRCIRFIRTLFRDDLRSGRARSSDTRCGSWSNFCSWRNLKCGLGHKCSYPRGLRSHARNSLRHRCCHGLGNGLRCDTRNRCRYRHGHRVDRCGWSGDSHGCSCGCERSGGWGRVGEDVRGFHLDNRHVLLSSGGLESGDCIEHSRAETDGNNGVNGEPILRIVADEGIAGDLVLGKKSQNLDWGEGTEDLICNRNEEGRF